MFGSSDAGGNGMSTRSAGVSTLHTTKKLQQALDREGHSNRANSPRHRLLRLLSGTGDGLIAGYHPPSSDDFIDSTGGITSTRATVRALNAQAAASEQAALAAAGLAMTENTSPQRRRHILLAGAGNITGPPPSTDVDTAATFSGRKVVEDFLKTNPTVKVPTDIPFNSVAYAAQFGKMARSLQRNDDEAIAASIKARNEGSARTTISSSSSSRTLSAHSSGTPRAAVKAGGTTSSRGADALAHKIVSSGRRQLSDDIAAVKSLPL